MRFSLCLAAILMGIVPFSGSRAEEGIHPKNEGHEQQLRLVMLLSRLAGAQSVCHPDVKIEPALRLCGEFIVARWPEITGGLPVSADEAKIFPVVWNHGVVSGSSIQKSGSGMSCDKLDVMTLKNSWVGYCPIVRNVLKRGG